MVAHHRCSGSIHALESAQAAQIEGTARKTLGTLVGDLLGSYVVAYDIDPPEEATTNSSETVNWVCGEFDDPSWELVYNRPIWERGKLTGGRINLDQDGTEELILQIGHIEYCGTSGCTIKILFGDQPAEGHPHGYGINSHASEIFIVSREGDRHVRFGHEGHLFPVLEIREDSISSMRLPIGG